MEINAKEFSEIVANVALIYSQQAARDLQEAYREDPQWALEIGRAALNPVLLAEKRRIDADERAIARG